MVNLSNTSNTVVHYTTKEDFDFCQKELNNLGSAHTSACWTLYKGNSCLSLNIQGQYSPIDYYDRQGHKILSVAEFKKAFGIPSITNTYPIY